MSRELIDWFAAHGIAVPNAPDLVQASIALVLAIFALGAGWLAGRVFGDSLTELWTRQVGGEPGGIAPRLRAIAQHGCAALLLALIAEVWHWHAPAALGLAFAEGAAVAMVAIEVLRGVRLPRWTAWTTGGLLFVAILSRATHGMAGLQQMLDRPFALGARQMTLFSILTAVVTVALLFAALRIATRVAAHVIGRSRSFDATQKLLGQKLASVALVVVVFFIGIDLLGIDLTTFAVFSGAFGLAVGFGLQKTIGNLIAGIILLMDRSIKPGDVIVVGESFGWVNKIGVRAVSVVTREGKEHLIPNENLMTQEVENWSYTDRNVRVRIPVRVAYDCDLKLAQELMLRAAVESPRALTTPQPNIRLTEFGESGVEHEILCWINDPEGGVGNVKSDVLNRLWVLFKEHDIEIPFPQREIRVRASLRPADAEPKRPRPKTNR